MSKMKLAHPLREKQLLQPCIILQIFAIVIKYFVQLVHSCLRETNMFTEQKQPPEVLYKIRCS